MRYKPPPLPPLPPQERGRGRGRGEGRRSCTNYTFKTIKMHTFPCAAVGREGREGRRPCAHLFILIIFDPISHIYAVHTQRKVYHSMPLHTYTVNFATSSNLQEILLAYRLHSNDPPFAHLSLLIMCEITTPIHSTHHSNIIFYT